MKKAWGRFGRWKKAVAWMLTIAMVSGNVSELALNTVYAAESASSVSDWAITKSRKVIDVKIDQEAIEKVLLEDPEDRPVLDVSMIPFDGDQKDRVLEKLEEELEGKTLILQKKAEKAMYLVVVADSLDGEAFDEYAYKGWIGQESILQSIQIIGVNGYKDRECQFNLQITGDQLNSVSADIRQYVIAGWNPEEETEVPATKETAGGSGGAAGEVTGEESESAAETSEDVSDTGKESSSAEDSTAGESSDSKETSGEAEAGGNTETEAGSGNTDSPAGSNEAAGGNEAADGNDEAGGNEAAGGNDVAGDNDAADVSEAAEPVQVEGAVSMKNHIGADVISISRYQTPVVASGTEIMDTGEAVPVVQEKEETKEAVKEEPGAAEPETSDKSEAQEPGSDETGSDETGSDETGSDESKAETTASDAGNESSGSGGSKKEVSKNQESIDRDAYDEPEVVAYGESRTLTEDELSLLMGINPEETDKKGRSAIHLLEQPSFQMITQNMGITVLDVEVNSIPEKGPYEAALNYYGKYAADKKEVVELKLSQSKTGNIKAGEIFSYSFSYVMQPAQQYEYRVGGKLSLYETCKNVKMQVKVPAGIILDSVTGSGTKVTKVLSDDAGSSLYEIPIVQGDDTIGLKSATINVNAWVDGNGARAVGETFAMEPDCVSFFAELMIQDKTDRFNITYPGNIETETYGSMPEGSSLTLISDDQWHIRKTLYTAGNGYSIIKDDQGDPQFVDITYLIEMGMYGANHTISPDASGTVYQTLGRTGFQAGSYNIKDTLEITTPGAPETMKPVSVSVKWSNGEEIATYDNPSSPVEISVYRTKGQTGDGKIEVSGQAPVYSAYLLTARYPYAPFLLNYNDSRVNDKSVFTVKNTAVLSYIKLGTSETVTEQSDVSVAVHESNAPAEITIKKYIDEGTGTHNIYNQTQEKEYPGYAEFHIQSVNADGSGNSDYTNYTVLGQDGQAIESKRILVNPAMEDASGETADKGFYVTGDKGSVTILVDPGTYIITETVCPTGTDKGPVTNGQVTLKAGGKAQVLVANEVVGKGSVRFIKKARTSPEGTDADLPALTGAKFGLYEKGDDGELKLVKEAVSDASGYVLFKPVTPGNYIVKEISANGYILDEKEYAVTVAADKESTLLSEEQPKVLVNQLNKAKVIVTKNLLNDKGSYVPVPGVYRKDFAQKFWFEQSLDGKNWTKVSAKKESLDSSSSFQAELPVYSYESGKKVLIYYRAAEQLPEGYAGTAGTDVTIDTTDKGTFVYKNFVLEPLKTTALGLDNERQVSLKLTKEVWEFSDAGKLTTTGAKKGYQFKLYETDRSQQSGFREVKPVSGEYYVTDSNGQIRVNGLDITKDYYWCEINGGGSRLEAEEANRNLTAVIDGSQQELIGPYTVSRESDTIVKAYNIPQKVPYWVYKLDSFNKEISISAAFKITQLNKDGSETVFSESTAIMNKGICVALEPGAKYRFDEITVPKNYIGSQSHEITTPSGPVTRDLLKKWTGSLENRPVTNIYNVPFQKINISKSAVSPDGQVTDAARTFSIYAENAAGKLESAEKTIISNQDTPVAPGTWYFKEKIPTGVINPYFLLTEYEKSNGRPGKFKVVDQEIYYGPVEIKQADKDSQRRDIYLGSDKDDKAGPLKNYMNNGWATIRKTDALRNTAVKGAEFGIFHAEVFSFEAYDSNTITPIQKVTTGDTGTAVFKHKDLEIYDNAGNKISYVIAELTAPAGYLRSRETITTTLKEGVVINTVNGQDGGAPLTITNEPMLTLRTQKYWIDSWSSQFYTAKHVLGNVRLGLYQAAADGVNANLVDTQITNTYDGMATFKGLNRNNGYYVVEARVPSREESGLSVDLTMPSGRINLITGDDALPETLPVNELKEKYNAVFYEGKALTDKSSLVQDTDPLYNYTSWVQFRILKTCDGIDRTEQAGTHEPTAVNGAKFALYKQLNQDKNLINTTYETMKESPEFELVDSYESGTRIDPKTGKRLGGQFDTTVLETGYVYWLAETEAAPGYELEGDVPHIVSVFVPSEGYQYSDDEKLHIYKDGRNDQIVIENKHSSQGGGTGAYAHHFQIAINKWLSDPSKSSADQLTQLGGTKFQLWLADPVTKEELMLVETLETGLEATESSKTGYALSRTINMGKLQEALPESQKSAIVLDAGNPDKPVVRATFVLKEISAPSRVQMDPKSHYLEVTVPAGTDYIDETYIWEKGDADEEHRLTNILSGEYPVTLVKYGYKPDSRTFGKTDDELNDIADLTRTPLTGVTFTLQRQQWTENGYEYQNLPETYTTKGGVIQIPGGLKSGRYRLKETLPQIVQISYMPIYTGNDNLWRYFTVGSSAETVNVYNPEYPLLRIEKTTWDGSDVDGLDGIFFSIQGQGQSVSRKTELENGSYAAVFENLTSGIYTITSEALPSYTSSIKNQVTNSYFSESKVAVGYKPQVNGENVVLLPVELSEGNSTVTGKVQTITLKNPQLAGLQIEKTDAETKESGSRMSGAEFEVSYQLFRTQDFENGVLKNVADAAYEKPSSGFDKTAAKPVDSGNGTYSLKNCIPGWYQITETKAPGGYTIATAPVIVAVTGDMAAGTAGLETAVTFENRQRVNLTVTKNLNLGEAFRDGVNVKIPEEIVFGVYTGSQESGYQQVKEDGKPVTAAVKNFKAADGIYTASETISLPQLAEGEAYYLKEEVYGDWMLPQTDAVTGGAVMEGSGENGSPYIRIGDGGAFTTKADVNIAVNNIYAKAKISLTKVDADDHNKLLNGASFELYRDPELSSKAGDFTAKAGSAGVYEVTVSTKENQTQTYYVKETNAPAGYVTITTAIPAGGITVETGKTTSLVVENQGGIDLHITKYSGNGNGQEAVREGIIFELYRKTSEGSWEYMEEAAADAEGRLEFRGLDYVEGTSYGVHEKPVKENGLDTYQLTSFLKDGQEIQPVTEYVIHGGVSEEASLYVVTDTQTKPAGVYEFEAHNQEAIPLKIVKNGVQNEHPADIKAFVRVSQLKDGESVQVGDMIPVPYGTEGVTVRLLPGEYELEETEISQNQEGYIINRDDVRTVLKKTVTIEKGKIPAALEFTNVKQETGVGLTKTTDVKEIRDLWWNDAQTVTYELVPRAVNTVPLDSYTVTDTGLVMLDESRQELPKEFYSDEKYTITFVKIGKAAFENYVKDAQTGTIMADVTFYGFDDEVVSTAAIDVSADNSPVVVPGTDRKIKSFSVSYRDDTFKNSTGNQYTLGQNFTPGAITVTAKVDKQDAKLPSGEFKKEIKYIRNDADVLMNYRSWDIKGNLAAASAAADTKAECQINVVQTPVPVISVNKQVTPADGVEVGTRLLYTLSVTNNTNDDDAAPFMQPVLVDHVPMGVTVSGELKPGSQLMGSIALTEAPEGISLVKTTRKVDARTGQETLFIQLKGDLKKGETVKVTVQAEITSSVVSYSKNIINKLYVTSNVTQTPSVHNQYGASFMIPSSDSNKWPTADLPEGALLPDESYRNYGYASSSAQNRINSGTGLTLFKEVKGNLDSRFMSGTDVGKVAKTPSDTTLGDADGSVQYRLTVNNNLSNDRVTKLEFMDILPAEGDVSPTGLKRLSDFRVDYVGISGDIQIVNPENPERNRAVNGYELSFTDQAFTGDQTTKKEQEDLFNGVKWSGGSDGATAFRIKITDPGFYLDPGENVVVVYDAVVPYETEKELDEISYEYAVNNFMITYSYRQSGSSQAADTQFSMVVFSNPVQIMLVPNNVAVGGHIWIDDDNNGVQDDAGTRLQAGGDLFELIRQNYFKVSLVKKSSGGNDEVNGGLGSKAEFYFDGLTPAKPFGISGIDFSAKEESSWYGSDGLSINKLKGSDPAHYQIYVTTGNMPAEYDDLILKLAKPNILTAKGEEGRSRVPQSLQSGGVNEGESRDSNFNPAAGIDQAYSSEDFFLWSVTDPYDLTKDIGFVPYRDVTVNKTNLAGRPVEGVGFSVYGPYTDADIARLKAAGIKDKAALGADKLVSTGTTSPAEDGGKWKAGELLYYRNYIIIEESAPAGYKVTDAASADMIPMKEYEVSGQAAWILESKDKQTPGHPVTGNITVTDQFVTGSLEFTKADEVTGIALPGAAFRIEQKESAVTDAWNAFTALMTSEQSTMGITDVKVSENSVEFVVTDGKAKLTGIPYGKYTLKEIKAPEGYFSLAEKAVYEFDITETNREVQLGNENVITNERAKFDLTLKKVDDSGRTVEGVSFKIEGPGNLDDTGFLAQLGIKRYQTDDKTGLGILTTDEAGQISLNLKHGDYRVTEQPVNGYDEINPFFIRISRDGGVSILKDDSGAARVETETLDGITSVSVVVTNRISTGSLEMEKVDSEAASTLLHGAEFTLTSLSSEVPGTWEVYKGRLTAEGASWTADEADGSTIHFVLDGRGIIYNLPYGQYRLTETKAPSGYLLGATPWSAEFTISREKNEIKYTAPGLFESTEGAITNDPSKITVVKTNSVYADEKLAGAEFIIQAADGSYVKLASGSFDGYTWDKAAAGVIITGSSGEAAVKRLPAGTYRFIETKAPSGYYINNEIPSITLDGVHSFTMTVQDVKISGGGGGDSGGSGSRPGGSSPSRDATTGPGAVTIIPDDVPLANIPETNNLDLLIIDDGEVPLAGLPKTGDAHAGGKILVLLSGIMAALYLAMGKKKEQDKQ